MDTYQSRDYRWIELFLVSLAMFLLLIHPDNLKAQDEGQKENLPESVVSAIETDFISCADKISWQVVETEPQQYTVKAEGRNISCEAVYDRNGRLIRSRTTMTDVKLPPAVHKELKSEYPEWTITGDQAVMRNFDENTKKFEIYLEKEDESITVYYDIAGKEVKSPRGIPTKATEISKEEVPEAVVNAVETDFFSCRENVKWVSDDQRTKADRYVATAKGKNVTCEATYDSDGKLIRSKTVAQNVKLPPAVHQALKSEYPEWKITGDQAVIRNFDDNTRYFEVYLEKEGESKTVYYNSVGEKVKPRYS